MGTQHEDLVSSLRRLHLAAIAAGIGATLLSACFRFSPQASIGGAAVISGSYHAASAELNASADAIIPEFVPARIGVDVGYGTGGVDALGNLCLFNTPYRRAPEGEQEPRVFGRLGWRFGIEAGRLAPSGAYEGGTGALLIGLWSRSTRGYLPVDEVFISINGRAGIREWMPVGTDRWALGAVVLLEWIHWRRAS